MSEAWNKFKGQTQARWLTNDPQIAAMLNDADTDFEKRKRKAQHLPLAEKGEAIRAARKQLAADYDAIRALVK